MNNTERKNRLSLTLFLSLIVFLNMLVTLVVITIVMNRLIEHGIIFVLDEYKPEGKSLLLFATIFSLVLGGIISFFTSRYPLRPVNKTISKMNRLAEGDFSARLEFDPPISKLPPMIEVSESFNKMAEELQNIEMLRGDFINNFSHEFKTPIVSIAGFAELLESGDLTEEERSQYIAAIKEESRRLAYMATNVLNLTKVENQSILTDKTSFNVSEQIRFCILLLESKWTEKNIDLDIDFDEHQIVANEELLKQVWINLFDNAVKFTDNGGVIKVTIKTEAKNIKISISNTGSEIPPEVQKKIFNKFYQADMSHSTQGNGIGLAIVKKIVELHNGSVTVTSENDLTTFTVTLPIEQ